MNSEHWKSALLGVVQGITEFLPISSSGHLIASKEIVGFDAGLALDVSLHVATLAAVVLYLRRDILDILRAPNRVRVVGTIALATIPGAALGYALSSWREHIGAWWVVGGWSVSSVYLLASANCVGERRYAELPIARGVLVGCAQALAIFPGMSRSGTSITAGLWLGLAREQAFRFSFLLSIPLIAGAGLKTALDLDGDAIASMGGWGVLSIGMSTSFAVGLASIHVLLRIVRGGRFHLFGWYNLAAAIAFAAYLLNR